MTKLKSKPRPTTRVQYGTGKVPLYWTVNVTDAKKDVTIDGTLMDALLGTPGETIGCHLSNCAKANADRFPHPFIVAGFTKSTCIVITKITGGAPSHGKRYVHSYGTLVDLNDTDKTRRMVQATPKLAERQFILRAPAGTARKGARHARTVPRDERKQRGWNEKGTGEKRPAVPRGALARARKAGLVTADLANALNSA